ncbi:YezD family protein [Butyrivibrio sp. YAB3001]|uniref:YezD family protein n=1 Tax=Butyrivibrio sp. YAB3001 TaxID=1520812 RepID=UPI0008F6273E|nr:YezD family protein [Butyrivibrio sp. YAB3001]SFB85542.1 hypothetical protein SAMN02910398_00885 [Butyrivibrio sp. YAB3001]
MARAISDHPKQKDVDKIWEAIKEQVNGLRYGSVVITVHDGKILQIETSSKLRFTN